MFITLYVCWDARKWSSCITVDEKSYHVQSVYGNLDCPRTCLGKDCLYMEMWPRTPYCVKRFWIVDINIHSRYQYNPDMHLILWCKIQHKTLQRHFVLAVLIEWMLISVPFELISMKVPSTIWYLLFNNIIFMNFYICAHYRNTLTGHRDQRFSDTLELNVLIFYHKYRHSTLPSYFYT